MPSLWVKHRAAVLAFAMTAVIASILVVGPSARAAEPSWRAVSFIKVRGIDGAERTPVELGRAAVGALSSPLVRRDAAGELGVSPAAVAGRSFQRASPADWTRVVVQYDGPTSAEAIRLRDATARAVAASHPGLDLTVWRTRLAHIAPSRELILLAAVGFVLGLSTAVAILVGIVVSARSASTRPGLLRAGIALTTTILLTAALSSALVARRPSHFALGIAASILLGVAVAAVAGRSRARRWALPALATTVGVLGAYSLVLWASGRGSTYAVTLGSTTENRIFPSPFGHPGHYGAALAMLLPFTLVGLQGSRTRLVTAAYGVATAAGTVALALTYARAAWLAAAVSSFVALSSWRARLIVLGGAVVLAAPFATKITDRVAGADYANDGRTDIWSQALSIIRDHPLAGVGVRNFPLHAAPTDTAFAASPPPHAHDLLLNTAAELGIPTAVALAALLGLLLAGLYRGGLRSTSPRDRMCARACAGAIVALLVAGLLDVAAHQRYTVPLAAIILGLAAAAALHSEGLDGRGGLRRRPRDPGQRIAAPSGAKFGAAISTDPAQLSGDARE